MHQKKIFICGLLGGVVATLLVVFAIHFSGVGSSLVASFIPEVTAAATTGSEKDTSQDPPPFQGVRGAPIKMIEYADFHCGFCRKAHDTVKQLLKNYDGKIEYIFKHLPLSSTPGQGSFLTHEAAACAEDQGKFWEYHDKIFEYPGRPARTQLVAFAQELNLDQGDFESCLESGRVQQRIQDDKISGRVQNVSGTPAFLINGEKISGAYPYEYFAGILDSILDPSKPKPTQEGQPVPTPQPTEIQFEDINRGPSTGPKNAPVTLVEFSDFHCPFCKRAAPALDQIMEKYSGKIRRIWRHYPLSFHQGAETTHLASECAHEQGKFWEYKERLFEKVGSFKTEESLIELADQLGLHHPEFTLCLSSQKYAAIIKGDVAEGTRLGVRGTPTFFINGNKVVGAQPFEQFEYEVLKILDPSKAKEPSRPKSPQKIKGPVRFDHLDSRPSQGPKNAKITLVEFSDFHCPFCKRAAPTLDQIMKNYKGQVRRVWYHYPLPMHPGAFAAHEAAQCAEEQGKFWEYKEKLFEALGSSQSTEMYVQFSEELGLNKKKFSKCIETNQYRERIKEDLAQGRKVGVSGTPAFYINGRKLSGAQPYPVFEALIQEELEKS